MKCRRVNIIDIFNSLFVHYSIECPSFWAIINTTNLRLSLAIDQISTDKPYRPKCATIYIYYSGFEISILLISYFDTYAIFNASAQM